MADEYYRFCKIFLSTPEPSTAMDLLAVRLSAQFQRRTMTLPDATVDVLRNPDKGAADDFVGWPTLVEVETEPHADNTSIVTIVSGIMAAMWDAGIPAVAACDFEDELRRRPPAPPHVMYRSACHQG